MASIYKPTYNLPIPGKAIHRKRGKDPPSVEYIDGKGKKQIRPIRLDREGDETDRMICEQKTWWMKYRLPDGTIRREKGFKDKLATEQEAARREREAEQAAAGIRLVDANHLITPLADHIEAFVADLERVGRSPKHYELLDGRLRRISEACGWGTLRQITPDSMSRYLRTLKVNGMSAKTQNEYLAAAKGFCSWCVRNRRLAGNPLASVTKTQSAEKTYYRRALTLEEIKRLLAVAGPRRLVYLLALCSGLRRSELRQLEWRDLHIDQDEKAPRIALRASVTKARRADVLPLREDVVAELLNAKPVDAQPMDRVFRAVPKMATFKSDLRQAKIPHVDASGRVADFHGLRVTYGTMLAKAGVAPRTHMELMRHTDMKLTMDYYTDPRLLDTARAVGDLPSLTETDKGAPHSAAALRTGTDDTPLQLANRVIALNRGSECPRGSISDHLEESEHEKTPEKRGFSLEAAGIEPATS